MLLRFALIVFISCLTTILVRSQTSNYVDSQIQLANKALEKRRYTKALRIIQVAQQSKKVKTDLEHLKLQKQIGNIYLSANKKDKSLSVFFDLLKKCSSSKHREMQVDVTVHIGYVYYEMEVYDKALSYYRKALKLSREIDYESGISMSINNVAAVLETKEQYEKAKSYFLQAIDINKSSGNEEWLGINYMNVGVIQKELGRLQSSTHWHNKADSIFIQIDAYNLIAFNKLKIAENHFENGQIDLSFQMAMIADSIARENEFLETYTYTNEFLAELYISQKDTSKAFIHQSIYAEAKDKNDELNNVEKALSLEQSFLLEKYETSRKFENEQHERNQTIILISIIFGGIIVLLLISKLYGQLNNLKKEKRKISQNLKDKNAQLATKTVELAKRQQTISNHLEIIERAVEKEDTSSKNSGLLKLKKALEKERNEDSISEFEIHFQEIHTQFYQRLNEQYPNLSRNERRLCVFLYLDMSSKEISTITGQRTSTIEVARTRLRKKLNLNQTGINLSDFLNKLGS